MDSLSLASGLFVELKNLQFSSGLNSPILKSLRFPTDSVCG